MEVVKLQEKTTQNPILKETLFDPNMKGCIILSVMKMKEGDDIINLFNGLDRMFNKSDFDNNIYSIKSAIDVISYEEILRHLISKSVVVSKAYMVSDEKAFETMPVCRFKDKNIIGVGMQQDLLYDSFMEELGGTIQMDFDSDSKWKVAICDNPFYISASSQLDVVIKDMKVGDSVKFFFECNLEN